MSYYTIAKPEVICKSHYLVVVVFVCLFVCLFVFIPLMLVGCQMIIALWFKFFPSLNFFKPV